MVVRVAKVRCQCEPEHGFQRWCFLCCWALVSAGMGSNNEGRMRTCQLWFGRLGIYQSHLQLRYSVSCF
ncbi:unnamed protein product [Toxocara canis]|uniref:Uncharacterized protein n=1 Tax=Toxocara canis TaxID=6265 RepID=A0A3P7GRN8_TOXCA|nr:unnamed protein product [Toxocara canis]